MQIHKKPQELSFPFFHEESTKKIQVAVLIREKLRTVFVKAVMEINAAFSNPCVTCNIPHSSE